MRIRRGHIETSGFHRSSDVDRIQPIASSRALVISDSSSAYRESNYAHEPEEGPEYAGSSQLLAQLMAPYHAVQADADESKIEQEHSYHHATVAYKVMATLPWAQSLGFSRSL